jgi:hypothetical protein
LKKLARDADDIARKLKHVRHEVSSLIRRGPLRSSELAHLRC